MIKRAKEDNILQWGRNMFVAECILITIGLFGLFHLQWGRNMFVAECVLSRVQYPQGIVSLQWGRNMFVAE